MLFLSLVLPVASLLLASSVDPLAAERTVAGSRNSGQAPSGQAPSGQTPPSRPAQPGAQTPPAPRRQPAARPVLELEVTDPSGDPVADVRVRVSGPVDREGRTDAAGALQLPGLRAGTYRLRLQRDGYIELEREVVLDTARRPAVVNVMLTPAPAPPPAPPPPPPPAASSPTSVTNRPRGEAATLDVLKFAEKNLIGRGEPQKVSTVGCTGYATTRIVQVRDPMERRAQDDTDEMLYVVAGDVSIRMEEREQVLAPGTLVVIPRSTDYTLSRRGRTPPMLLSVLSGPACVEAAR